MAQTKNSDRLLDKIDSPADLRKLPVEALPQVCAEIREFLIEKCAVNPGHFASSMGAVELTVALHYVFDTPGDRLVWDVGHQAYGHKILTGRRDRFDSNRKLGGLSGFPNPAESPYDTFTAGHASNSISAALGMAVAARLKGERRNVVAIIGDASVSGGLAFEGINNAANTPNDLLIILNDNDMSIDHNVGSLNSYLAHLTTSPAYNRLRYNVYLMLRRLHLVTERGRRAILRFNNSLKSLIFKEQNIFEGLNIRYFGPFDGHDVIRIVRVLRDIRDMQGPRLLHLRTVKGKGYAPAERDPANWHAPGKFDPVTGKRDCEGQCAAGKAAQISGRLRPHSHRTRPLRQTYRRHHSSHAVRHIHVDNAKRTPRPRLRCRHIRKPRRDLRRRFGQGRHAPVRRHILQLPAARLRPYHPRRGYSETPRDLLYRSCRTRRRGRNDTPWGPSGPLPYLRVDPEYRPSARHPTSTTSGF